MSSPQELIYHLKLRHPATWSLVKLAASQGLVELGVSGESLKVSPDLQSRHPRLHQILAGLLDADSESSRATVRHLFDEATPIATRQEF